MDDQIVIDSRDRSKPIVLLPAVAAAAGLMAAVVHAAFVREHFMHWWGYGSFFAIVAAAQALAAVSLYRRPSRKLLLVVAAGDFGLIALYALSRTVGTPFIGPHAGHTEPVGTVDLIANAAECVQLAVILFALRHPTPIARLAVGGRRVALVALVAVAAVAVAVPGDAAHQQRPSSPILILAADQIPNLPDPHDTHTEATPAPAITEETPLDEEPPQPCTPRLGSGGSASIDGSKSAIVYSHEGDLWLAAPPWGQVRRLTTDGWDCSEQHASFRDADTITFAADTRIFDLDLETNTLRRLVDVPTGVAALAWNPNGSALAYTTWENMDDPPSLRIFKPSTGSSERVRTFSGGGGRCGGMDDELSVAWSPDGRSILVVATYLDFSGETMFVVRSDGTDIVPPRMGTHARWLSGSTVVFREFIASRRWFSLDLDDGRQTTLAMQAGTHHAAVSPDGTKIAYSDEQERPALYLYDVKGRVEQELARGYGAPIWISSDRLAVTKTKPCDGDGCMGHDGWMSADETAAFDLTGERTGSLSMESTLFAAAFVPPEGPPAPEAPSPSPAPPSSSPTPTETGNPLPLSAESPAPSPESSETPAPAPSASPTESS